MKNFFKLLAPVLFITVWAACKKDTKTPDPVTPPAPQTGTLKLSFANQVDGQALVFGQNYVNANGDTFQVSRFNYYISNIVLTKTDNSTYAEPNSYHIVNHGSPSSTTISIAGVPLASYKSVTFMLGVDSTRNVSGAQTGALDPVIAGDMFWDWNTGYIALKLEGTSSKSPAADKSLTFHIGGYGGVNKAQRNFNLSFGTTAANVASATTPIVHLNVNAAEMFKTPTTINFATDYYQMSAGAGAKKYADNYADMITFDSVQN